MEIGPQNRPCHRFAGMQHVMMIVPIDADVNEAENVAQKFWHQGHQRIHGRAVRDLELQHHDGDDDGDDAVAECFESAVAHSSDSVKLNCESTASIRENSMRGLLILGLAVSSGAWAASASPVPPPQDRRPRPRHAEDPGGDQHHSCARFHGSRKGHPGLGFDRGVSVRRRGTAGAARSPDQGQRRGSLPRQTLGRRRVVPGSPRRRGGQTRRLVGRPVQIDRTRMDGSMAAVRST